MTSRRRGRPRPGRWLGAIVGPVAAFSLLAAACGGEGEVSLGEPGTPIELTVGALVPQTGDLSRYGPAGEKAAKLAVTQARAALEAAGSESTVSLEVGDTETDPRAALEAADELIADGSSCLVGAWGSMQTATIGQALVARREVPLISPASTSPEITDLPDEGYVFRTAPSDVLRAPILADAVGEELGTDATISVAGRDDSYGEGLTSEFTDAFEAAGGEVDGPALYPVVAPSYEGPAAAINSSKPDGYVIVDFEQPYGRVGSALIRTDGFDAGTLFTADGLEFDRVPETIPESALDGASGVAVAAPGDTKAGREFADLYAGSKLGPKDLAGFEAQSFDATSLCVLAAVAAGSDDGPAIRSKIADVAGPPGRRYDHTQIDAAVAALEQGEEIDFQGVSGPLDLDSDGDPTVATYELFSYDGRTLQRGEQVEVGAGR